MSKKSKFRGPFENQHGKSVQALLESTSEHPYHIHLSLPSQLSWKNLSYWHAKILWLLVNTLAADEKYPVINFSSEGASLSGTTNWLFESGKPPVKE